MLFYIHLVDRFLLFDKYSYMHKKPNYNTKSYLYPLKIKKIFTGYQPISITCNVYMNITVKVCDALQQISIIFKCLHILALSKPPKVDIVTPGAHGSFLLRLYISKFS